MLAIAAAMVAAALLDGVYMTRGTLQPHWPLNSFMRSQCFGAKMSSHRARHAPTTWFVVWQWLRVVACVAITDRADHYWLHNLCVRDTHRRRGWARRLYAEALRHCRSRAAAGDGGRNRVMLKVYNDNTASSGLLDAHLPEFTSVPELSRAAYTIYSCSVL